jgi:hypothetical protein
MSIIQKSQNSQKLAKQRPINNIEVTRSNSFDKQGNLILQPSDSSKKCVFESDGDCSTGIITTTACGMDLCEAHLEETAHDNTSLTSPFCSECNP